MKKLGIFAMALAMVTLIGCKPENKGGGGGTSNYEDLENKPQIAGTTLSGNKSLADLGIASAQSVSNITNGESINNFAGVETALSNKQGTLIAGDYIGISNNEVSVNRYVNPAGDIVYRAVTVNATTAYVDKYTPGGTFIERINITVNTYQSQDVESKIRFYREFDGWVITLLANSKEHNAGYSYSARTSAGGVESQNDFTFTISQTLDDNDLIIRSELATKADTDMVAADFNAGTSYTAGNYCVQDGKLYKFKVNHSGAWSAADVDEVKITGELSALKSGLTNLLKYKTFNDAATDTTSHLYSTGVSASQYVCVGGCTPYNPNFNIQLSNIEVTTNGFIRYRLYDVATNQIVSDNAAYVVYLVFVDTSMLSELVITP